MFSRHPAFLPECGHGGGENPLSFFEIILLSFHTMRLKDFLLLFLGKNVVV